MKIFGKMAQGLNIVLILLLIPSCINSASDEFNIENALGKENLVDILICGSGPGGLSAAIHGSRSRLRTLVVEGHTPGGQLTRTTWVENFPGQKKIMGPELMETIKEQAASFGAEFLSDSVVDVDFSTWPYKVTTEDGLVFHAMTVIVATGVSPASLGIPGEEEYFGRGVSHCAICDGPFYKGEDVVVVGGGDSALEEATQLAPYARKITVLVRSYRMRAIKIMQERIEDYPNIFVRYNTSVKEIIGDGDEVTGVRLLDRETKKEYMLPVSGVFLAIGSKPNTAFLKGEVEMDERGYLILKGRTQKSSRKGVFGSGDVESDRGHQAVIAAGSGVQAAIDAVKFLTEEVGLSTKAVKRLKKSYYAGLADAFDEQEVEIKEVETEEAFYDTVQNSKEPVVFDFYADPCPSCDVMLPLFKSVAKEYGKKAQFFKVNRDELVDVSKKYAVRNVPCILIFKDGKLVATYRKPVKNKKELSDLVETFVDLNNNNK